MGRVDDWYKDRYRVVDLQPGFDYENDDQPDPYVLGESEKQPWGSVYGKASRESSGVTHSGVRSASNGSSGSTSKPLKSRTPSARTWQQAVREWLAHYPNGGYAKCAQAVAQAGYPNVTRAMVAQLMQQDKKTQKPKVAQRAEPGKHQRTSTPRAARARTSRPSQPKPVEPVVRVKYCESCNGAIREDGRCRC